MASGARPSRFAWRTHLWPLERQHLLRTSAPILCGPWLSEVGFEALYWIPFLDRLVEAGVDRSRLIPITRGGAAHWYGTPQGFDLFSIRTPRDLRVQLRLSHRLRGTSKQYVSTTFDQDIITEAAAKLSLSDYHVLHPSWMYWSLAPYWEGRRGLAWLQDRASYQRVLDAPLPGMLDQQLPAHYVAVKFYARPTLGASQQAKRAIRAIIGTLCHFTPVVVLSAGGRFDDHPDFELPAHPNLIKLADLMPIEPTQNLAIQSAVIARSEGVVGTYGGLLQLALRMRKQSVSFYETWGGTAMPHKHLTDAISLSTGIAAHVIRFQDIGILESCLPEVVMTPRPAGVPVQPPPDVVDSAAKPDAVPV